MRGLVRELRRRKVFRMAGFYIVGAWLVMQAADVFFPAWGLPDAALNILLIAAVVGFPLALVFGWFYDVTTHGIVRTPALDEPESGETIPLQRTDYLVLAALAGIAVFIVFRAGTEIVETPRVEVDDLPEEAIDEAPPLKKLPNSIAVLPFANVSDDPANEYFCDGISEEILHKLGEFRDLHVIGRTSSFAFKGSDYRIPKIASLLGVQYLLQGSVRKFEDELRITAQLVDENGVQTWSSAFDRRYEDVFAIQTEIADVVAMTILPKIVPVHDRTYEPDLKAYQHYLLGREYLHQRKVPGARKELAKAVEIDPNFADAQAEYGISMLMWAPDETQRAAGEQAIQRALELAPGLPRARAAEGMQLVYWSQDYAAAEEVLRRVLADDPNMVDAMNWLFTALLNQGKEDEGIQLLDRALRIDPMHPAIAGNLAWTYFQMGRLARAEEILVRLSELPEPNGLIYSDLIQFYHQTGRLVEMVEHARRMAFDPVFGQRLRAFRYAELASAYALLNDWESVERVAEQGLKPAPDGDSRLEYDFWIRLHYQPESWRGRFQEAVENYRSVMATEGWPPEETEQEYGVLLALAGDHAAAKQVMAPLEDRPADLGDGSEISARQALAWSYSVTGRNDKAVGLLQELDRLMSDVASNGTMHRSEQLFAYARNAALLGQADLALDRLQRAVDAGWRDYYVDQHDPRWGALKGDARYQALMAEVKADVERQRAEVARLEADEDVPALLDKVREKQQATAD